MSQWLTRNPTLAKYQAGTHQTLFLHASLCVTRPGIEPPTTHSYGGCLSHTPIFHGHGTLTWKIYKWQSVERDKLFFDPIWLVPWFTHMIVCNLKDNFSFKGSQILSSNSKVKQCFLWDHSVNCDSSRRIYITNAYVAMARFLSLLHNKGRWIIRGKNHYKHEHAESWFCKRSLLRRHLREDWVCSVSKCFQSLTLQQSCDRLRPSRLAKLSFKLTNILFENGRAI